MQIAAVVLGVGPLYALTFCMGLQSLKAQNFVLNAGDLIGGLIVMIGFGAFLIALLLLLGEQIGELQTQRASLSTDIAAGLVLTLVVLVGLMALRLTLAGLEALGLFPLVEEIPASNLEMVGSVAKDPLLLALFLGPVIWIQAAVVEELTRVFVLSRLWKVWPARRARVISLLAWSAIFGLAHIYQGATGVLGTALIGLILGSYYLQRGRFLPLIIAHGLYDTIATLALLYAVRHPEVLPSALL